MDTVSVEEPGMFHVFPILMPWADASRRAYRSVAAFVDERLPQDASGVGRGEADAPTVADTVDRAV